MGHARWLAHSTVRHLFPSSVLPFPRIQIVRNSALHQAPPTLPSLSAHAEGGPIFLSPSTYSEVVRVQVAERAEREPPAARRTSLLSPPQRLNCPTGGMKASRAALFLLLFLLLPISSVSHSQTSESACPCRATMRKGNGTAGSGVTPKELSDLCPPPGGLSPPASLSAVFKLSPS